MIRNRVLLVLVLLAIAAALGLGFLAHAPNRLLSGRPVSLAEAASGARLLALLPAVPLLIGAFLPQRRAVHGIVAAAAALLLIALVWLAGAYAAAVAAGSAPAERTSLSGAFWVLFLCAALALADALRRLGASPLLRVLAAAIVAGGIAALVAGGALDQLALFKEYAARREAFGAAVIRHLVIVASALVPTILIGVPLGVAAQRRHRLRARLLPILNIVQTIPSVALFGLLITPISTLASVIPALADYGISGIGLAPAIIALVLYSLLPIVRNTIAGLDNVPAATGEAARGMGMTQRQIFWLVELPLAFPVFLSGLRVTTVQAIGLAAVAALIGAGGLGAIVFQGLFANAQDLVLLGTVPLIALALAADALLMLAASGFDRRPA